MVERVEAVKEAALEVVRAAAVKAGALEVGTVAVVREVARVEVETEVAREAVMGEAVKAVESLVMGAETAAAAVRAVEHLVHGSGQPLGRWLSKWYLSVSKKGVGAGKVLVFVTRGVRWVFACVGRQWRVQLARVEHSQQ